MRRAAAVLEAAILAVSLLPMSGAMAPASAADQRDGRAATAQSLGPGSTYLYEDQDGVLVRAVNSGWNLNEYLYRGEGPITFSIDVAASFGAVDADGFPVSGNALFDKTGRLTLRVWDVDDDYAGTDVAPEQDEVVMNGHTLPGFLQGSDGQWSVSTFAIDLNYLKLPTAANPTGQNDFEVLIDTANTGEVWAVEVASAELRLETVSNRPVEFIHGIDAKGGTNNMGEFRQFFETNDPALAGHAANPTALGSIGDREAAIAPTIDDLLTGSGEAKTNLVAHSMGGLVARRYAHDHPENVGTVVMLGTPNGGSTAIDIACEAENMLPSDESPFSVNLPCWREGQALFENTTEYVRNVGRVPRVGVTAGP